VSVTPTEYLPPEDAQGSGDADTAEALLLTVREAAALMRVGRDTAYALVAEGRIPSIRLGRQIRIPRGALVAHLEREAIKRADAIHEGKEQP
jgi:excisionase family DNA binding protein